MTNKTRLLFSCVIIVINMFLASCSKEESNTDVGKTSDYQTIALEFTKLLTEREYSKAYQMTVKAYRIQNSVEQLRTAFETIVPTDWGPMGPIEVGHSMTTWRGKQASDIGWVYVSIGGDVYSEAIAVIVASESGEAKIRDIEFGRP